MTDLPRGAVASDHQTVQMTEVGQGISSPSVCVILEGRDGGLTTALYAVQRFGFDHAYLVDAAEPDQMRSVLRTETVASNELSRTLRNRSSQPDEPVMLVVAGRGLDRFNWLDLVPQLASRPHCSALIATLSNEPDLAVAGLIKPGAIASLAPVDPLVGLAAMPASVTLRYDPAGFQPGEPRPAVFFDRDGVINEDRGYVGDVSRFAFLPDAIAGVKAANDCGALAFLVTNQSGVARGLYTEQDVTALHRHMTQEMRRLGAHFDDIRICPHLPDGVVAPYRLACRCRKPEPGMLLDLLRDWPVERTRSVMIGDKESDMAAARAAGLTGILYRGGSLAELVTASGT